LRFNPVVTLLKTLKVPSNATGIRKDTENDKSEGKDANISGNALTCESTQRSV